MPLQLGPQPQEEEPTLFKAGCQSLALVSPAAGAWPWCSGRCVGGELCRSTAAELHVISKDPLFNLELYGVLGRWGMSSHAPYQQLVCEVPFCLELEVVQQLA